MKTQRSLNVYLFLSDIQLIFSFLWPDIQFLSITCELLWHLTKYFCLDLNREIMDYEDLREKSFFFSVVDI